MCGRGGGRKDAASLCWERGGERTLGADKEANTARAQTQNKDGCTCWKLRRSADVHLARQGVARKLRWIRERQWQEAVVWRGGRSDEDGGGESLPSASLPLLSRETN